jgi:hypothetical protein
MHYIVTNRYGDRFGKFTTEELARQMAQRLTDQGIYSIVECYDNDTRYKLTNFVFASNETNWVGENGQWNTNDKWNPNF